MSTTGTAPLPVDVAGGLQQVLVRAAAAWPDHTAVVQPGAASITYDTLDQLSNRLRDRLFAMGISAGDRVGIYLPKSINSMVAIYGALKTGSAYVPVDPAAPASRNAYIFNDCQCRAVIVHERFSAALAAELGELGSPASLLIVPAEGREPSIAGVLEADPAPERATYQSAADDLAYLLYTSGSTGKPKGVMLNHENALSFVDWCSNTFQPTPQDRCSSHAPLHFDLSILDVHMTIKHGATLVLFDEQVGKDPKEIVALMASERLTIWYSAPSILTLLVQFGEIGRADLSSLRLVLFAGEVFPVKHLRDLKSLVPHPAYYNLYGPTETNVCTCYRVPDVIPADRTTPMPIGPVCAHLFARLIDVDGREVGPGEEGELLIRGGNVTPGYWNLPENNARAFHTDADGVRWYRTGDLVVMEDDGNYRFVGRRDRMVKKRGYRIELGEIESCLYTHERLDEVAVVAKPDEALGLKIYAFVAAASEAKPSIIELKAFCAKRLPSYMVPDVFVHQARLPKTSTDKIDYRTLLESC